MAKEAVEVAPSGRGMCGHCKQGIAEGALRFGFKLDGSVAWFHLQPCAASVYPEKVEYALERSNVMVPDRKGLEAAIEAARPAARRARLRPVDRAPTGRATCRHCKQLVAKGTLRANWLLYDDTSTGALHVACVNGYVGSDASADLVAMSKALAAADKVVLANLFAALALLDAGGEGTMLERAIAGGDTAAVDVLADWLEEHGAALSCDELEAALQARRASARITAD
jgi:hypothetical protein